MVKLNKLNAWSGASEFFGRRSAQSYFITGKAVFAVSGACGSACGAGDGKPEGEPKPSSCGSACGAGDK